MFFLLTTAFITSCDYLDKEPDDMLTLDMVFNSADNTEQWLAELYNLVPDPLWDYVSYDYGYYMMSDEAQMASSLGQFGWSVSPSDGAKRRHRRRTPAARVQTVPVPAAGLPGHRNAPRDLFRPVTCALGGAHAQSLGTADG